MSQTNSNNGEDHPDVNQADAETGKNAQDINAAPEVVEGNNAESAENSNTEDSNPQVSVPEPAENENTAESAEPCEPVDNEPAQDAANSEKSRSDSSGKGKPNGKKNGSSKKDNSSGKNKDNSHTNSIPWDQPLALIKFGRMRRVELFAYSLEKTPKRGEKAVIRTDRGVELGEIITPLAQLTDGNQADAQQEIPDQQPPCGNCQSCQSANAQVAEDNPEQVEGEDSQAQTGQQENSQADQPVACENFVVDAELCLIDCGKMREVIDSGSPNYGYHRNNRILRMASAQDISDQHHLDINAVDKQKFCRNKARELKLNMRLAGVEHLLGGERIVFYFTSEARVDFRELVRELAGQYRTRIEMRQIGARDEARLAGDYERCGRQCCCQVFLGELQPVSIRMAKVQKATLDPTKISGRCNRLMCCLRYEDSTYEELRRKLPRRNTWVTTTELVGRVIDSQIITQLVRVVEPNGAVSYINNEDIVDRNLTEQPAAPAPKPQGQETSIEDEFADAFDFFDGSESFSNNEDASGEDQVSSRNQGEDAPPERSEKADQEKDQSQKPRRNNRGRSRRSRNSGDKKRSENNSGNNNRRRRRKPRNNSGNSAENNKSGGNKEGGNSKPSKNNRRRRRRKPRGGSQGNNNSSSE